MGNKVNDEMKQNLAIDTETITRVKASSVASGPFVTHCREDLVKPLRHPTPLRHVHPWDIDGNDDANEYRRFNLGGTVNFWFVNRGLTLLLKAVPLRPFFGLLSEILDANWIANHVKETFRDLFFGMHVFHVRFAMPAISPR